MLIPVERIYSVRSDIRDTGGRHFVPGQTKPTYVQNSIPGREGHLTDAGAWEEFTYHKSDVLSLIAFLREGFPTEQLTVEELDLLSVSLDMLPAYLTLRASNPVNEHALPSSTIDTHRASLGILLAATAIIQSGVDGNTHITSDEIYDFINGKNGDGINYFVSAHGKHSPSCPASKSTVIKVLETMLYPTSKSTPPEQTDWGAYLTKDEIPNILQFGPAYFAFIDILEKDVPTDIGEQLTLNNKTTDLYYAIHEALGFTVEM